MSIKYIILFALTGFVLGACKKSPKQIPETEPESYENVDLGIQFTRYDADSVYATDTVQNEFRITNYSNVTIKAGNVLKLACSLNNVQFALDLIGEGPSSIELTDDLAPGASFVHNPGYLLRQSILDYFQSDTVPISVMVFGVNNVVISPTFESDPNSSNNKDRLLIFSNGLKLE
jgi:hypothetical protein